MNIMVTHHPAPAVGTSASRDASRFAAPPEAHTAPAPRGARGHRICVVTFNLVCGRLAVTGGHRYDF